MTISSNWPPTDMSDADVQIILEIRDELYRLALGPSSFELGMVKLVRQAIDEVIDTARSGRFLFEELDSTEKAYVGVRTEILFRNEFSLERGLLDVIIAGHDVDIKNTTSGTWMIPTHSVGKACLLVKSEPRSDPGSCSVGLAIADESYLNAGANQDKKRTFKAAHRNKILWLFEASEFPGNVFERLAAPVRRQILGATSGAARVALLFESLQRVPVPRHVVEAVARQTDAAKRVRRNGGARDLTEPKNLYIFSFDQQRRWIEQFDLPPCSKGDYISLTPKTDAERQTIAAYLAEDVK